MSVRYEESPPPPELRNLVHRIWWLQGDAVEGPAPFQRVMPDGRAELIFNLADPFESRSGETVRLQPLALLVGPNRRAMDIRPTGAVDLIGVRFRPEALSGWLRVSGGELLDRAYDLDEVSAPLDWLAPRAALPRPRIRLGGWPFSSGTWRRPPHGCSRISGSARRWIWPWRTAALAPTLSPRLWG